MSVQDDLQPGAILVYPSTPGTDSVTEASPNLISASNSGDERVIESSLSTNVSSIVSCQMKFRVLV